MEKVKNLDKLEELLRTLEDRANDLTESISDDKEKSIYNELYKLTQDIISQAENENQNPAILNVSKTLENYSQKAKNKSAGAKLLTLSKDLYRCYDRNRKYK